MNRSRLLIPILIVLVIVAAAIAVFVKGSDGDNPEDLTRAADVMAAASFTTEPMPCPSCRGDRPPVVEFAPNNNLIVRNYDAYEAWNFYLYLDGKAYFSTEGKRWWEGFHYHLISWFLADPRVLLKTIGEPSYEGTETVNGRESRLYKADLDDSAFVELLPPEIREMSEGGFLEFISVISVALWIDIEDQRVLKLAAIPDLSNRPQRPGNTPPPPGGDPPPESFERIVEYRPVDIPATVESRPAGNEDDDYVIREITEQNAGRIGLAIEEYFRRNGVFPPIADEATLTGLLERPWPQNVFRDRPMRDSDDAGDYSYIVKAGRADYEFRIRGWDGDYLFFERSRVDAPFQPRGKPLP